MEYLATSSDEQNTAVFGEQQLSAASSQLLVSEAKSQLPESQLPFVNSKFMLLFLVDPGCLFRIPDPGSKIFRISIRIKELKNYRYPTIFLTQKNCFKLSETSQILDPGFIFFPSRIQGQKST
jgi:hypothetical protein